MALTPEEYDQVLPSAGRWFTLCLYVVAGALGVSLVVAAVHKAWGPVADRVIGGIGVLIAVICWTVALKGLQPRHDHAVRIGPKALRAFSAFCIAGGLMTLGLTIYHRAISIAPATIGTSGFCFLMSWMAWAVASRREAGQTDSLGGTSRTDVPPSHV